MPINKEKKQIQWGKTQLVDEIFEKIKKESSRIKITKSQLNELIETFLQTVKAGLENSVNIALKNHFSLIVTMSKETLKNNPRDRQQKLIIPAQKRVRIRVSNNWKKSLNPLMRVTDDLKKTKKINDLEMIYKVICGQEIYQTDKKRIDKVYDDCLTKLRVVGKK